MRMKACFGSPIAAGLAILMMLPLGDPIRANAQESPSSAQEVGQSPQSTASQQPPSTSSRDDAGAAPQTPDAPSPSASRSNQSSDSSATPEQQNRETKPLGTAAAPYTKPTGVMGSRPAGAVIAPAKQRRVHAILISVGILAGAGIAIGTVAALSKGSPSRP